MRLLCFVFALTVTCLSHGQTPKPKLVVLLVADQFRGDYLTRFRSLYNDGLDRLLRQGTVFTDAHHSHYITTTAPGHAAMLSGAGPAVTGIMANEWYDAKDKKQVTSVTDFNAKVLGGKGTAASPHRLLAPTVGDMLKEAGSSKVIGISLKDRGAILPPGKKADAAYWYDQDTGNFLSSTYYQPQLPEWVSKFNSRRLVDQFIGKTWAPFLTMASTPSKDYWTSVYKSPFGNELLEQFAEAAIESEQLGRRDVTDLLVVSFSSNDPIGHSYGPDSAQVKDVSVQTDKIFGKFFRFLDAKIGMQNVTVVFTADHGVARVPQQMIAERKLAGRLFEKGPTNKIASRLYSLYGPGKWVVGNASPAGDVYLNRELIAAKNLSLRVVRQKAAQAAREIPHIARVYTWDQLNDGMPVRDQLDRLVLNAWNPARSPDVILIPAENYFFSKDTASHGSPYDYDSHVPLIFMGAGFVPGEHKQRVSVYDLAPTLANALGIPAPAGSRGHVIP